MKRMTVWIIEDDDLSRAKAAQAVRQAAGQEQLEVEISGSSSLDWPPAFDDEHERHHARRPPDVVVLDLYDPAHTLRGDVFYRRLRESEGRDKAFVIIWSGYTSEWRAEKFLLEAAETDARLVPLKTKDTASLADAVKGCFGRLEEER